MKLGASGEFPSGKLNEADESELTLAISSDKTAGKVLVQFGKSIKWIGMDAVQARGLAALLINKANELDQRGEDLDWTAAFEHFRSIRSQYQQLAGTPGVNTHLALINVFQPLAKRYYAGERTQKLYQEMMAVE